MNRTTIMENKPHNLNTQKGNQLEIINHKPIVLINTIYKLFTTTFTAMLSIYGKNNTYYKVAIRFRQEKSTTRQIQTLLATLEDVRLTNQDIHI